MCFISSRVLQAGKASRAVMYLASGSGYWAEDMTALMTFMLESIEALRVSGRLVDLIGSLGLSERWK